MLMLPWWKNKRKRGFSLVELLLVLGVMAVILIAAFVIYPRVRSDMKVKQEIEYVNKIEAQIKNNFASTGNYKQLSSMWQVAKQNEKEWTKSPNGWNWSVVGYQEGQGSACTTSSTACPYIWFQLGYRASLYGEVPNEAECQKMLMALSTRMKIQNFSRNSVQFDPSSAVQICDRGGNDPIYLSFYSE